MKFESILPAMRDEDIERAQSVIGEMNALAPVQEV